MLWVDGRSFGWMDGWMAGWVAGWVGGWVEYILEDDPMDPENHWLAEENHLPGGQTGPGSTLVFQSRISIFGVYPITCNSG